MCLFYLYYSYGEEKLQVWEIEKSMVKTISKVELLISCGISEVVKLKIISDNVHR